MTDFNPTAINQYWFMNAGSIPIVTGSGLIRNADPSRTSIRFQNTTPYGIYLANTAITTAAEAVWEIIANGDLHLTLEKDGGFPGLPWYYLAFNAGGYLYVLSCSFRTGD